ncbi:ATP synthase F1 subunit delta [Fuchsiella alkaliacetigena]|uniref:ATP synthase F1 subunit delta n=1 Tax=Fuchsiella alkaliacetigena TaxID=957042 RepID=UPI00200B4707|nr:ATP synthase F1 subunit delta [Fuchsiella alkaliacetigena]MCK8824583.1 ATP synthase F1 subunit delta [Fuchsiella alkaliacetigena]
MLNNQIAEKYSQALFELTSEKDQLNEVKDDLIAVVETISDHNDLQEVIYHPQISNEDKKQLVEKLFADEVSKTLLNFLKLLIDKRREHFLEAILDRYLEYVDREKGILEVEVISAFELTAENKDRLATKLAEVTNKEIRLKTQVDRDLLGGLVLKIGDRVVDGSLKKELESVKEEINKIEVSKLEVS